MKYRRLFLALITATLLPSVVSAQIATVEFGDGAKLVSRSFKEESTARAFEISADYPELQKFDQAYGAKTESLLSSCFPIVVIEHTTKPFTTLNGLID
jgi:hypothetical protein